MSGWDLPTRFHSRTQNGILGYQFMKYGHTGVTPSEFVFQLQSSELWSTRTSQLILIKVKLCQFGELPNLCRDGTCQRIFSHKLSKW